MPRILTPKENYLMMLRGEIPEYVPSYFEMYTHVFDEELLTPARAPEGPIVTSLGVTYVGSPDNNYGAMPKPGEVVLEDITKWRDVVKVPDISGRDWESYYKKQLKDVNRDNLAIATSGGDYFLTLVSLMGFENALMAMYEELEEVKALLEYISDFYLEVLKQQIRYAKMDYYILMDDDSSYRAPFFSVDMYRDIFKPLHKKHCDILNDEGILIDRHDCGKCEQFIDDWLDLGIKGWNPCQITNDLKAIKKKYVGRLALEGCWDSQGILGSAEVDDNELKDALIDYVDTFAPGGGFAYMPIIGGNDKDPKVIAKRDIVKKVYYDYAKNYYKTH